MKEAPGFITGNELIDPGAFVLLHCFFYEYDFRFGHCISIQNFIQLVCLDQIFFQNQLSYNFSGFQRCFRDSCGGLYPRYGQRAVAIPALLSIRDRHLSRFAVIPLIQLSIRVETAS